ncbi:unnamed protein product [Rhizophagus irregularis]|nr:unnamed protein product [Rhizophagus irregularis]
MAIWTSKNVKRCGRNGLFFRDFSGAGRNSLFFRNGNFGGFLKMQEVVEGTVSSFRIIMIGNRGYWTSYY